MDMPLPGILIKFELIFYMWTKFKDNNVIVSLHDEMATKKSVEKRQSLKNEDHLDLQKSETEDETHTDLHCWSFGKGNASSRKCEIFQGVQVKLVSLGDSHVVILTKERRLFSWGSNSYGQLGLGDTDDREHLCPVLALSEKTVSRVSCGSRHSAVICKGGQVYCWGDSRQGQCGQGSKGIFTTPCRVQFVNDRTDSVISLASLSTTVSDITKVVKIRELACGGLHTLAVDSRGRVWVWGTGAAALGLGRKIDEVLIPTKIKDLERKHCINIACGLFHNVIVIQNDFHGSLFEALESPTRTFSNASTVKLSSRTSTVTQKIPFFENVFYEDKDISEASKKSSSNVDEHETILCSTDESVDSSEESKSSDKEIMMDDSESTIVNDVSYPRIDKAESIINKIETGSPENVAEVCNDLTVELDVTDATDRDLSNPGLHFENELYKLNLDEIKPYSTDDDDDDVQKVDTTKTLEIPDICIDTEGDRDSFDDKCDLVTSSRHSADTKFKETEDSGAELLGPKELDSSNDDIYHSAWSVPQHSSVVALKKREISTVNSTLELLSSELEATKGRPKTMFEFHSSALPPDMLDVSLVRAKNRSSSMWSIATVMNSSEIDTIGSSVPVFGLTEVWIWGKNSYGQLGIGNTKDR